ncbi:CLL_HP2_G0000850.mRNA.1.CDS.1 [Saccharomyces cerevisiae]|nr:CLL_HP2_G0000850.mRNA.1.CDS.1 [Saccharomyces cerevisiae]CAI6453197.1 CLL_HP2_G0000850.mRNA.1.CDS.1 [Saccharomyces cerevisiae]
MFHLGYTYYGWKSLKRYSIPKLNQLSMITPGLGMVYLMLLVLLQINYTLVGLRLFLPGFPYHW